MQGKLMLPDYLWGIETASVRSARTCWSSFQTTYEELKLGTGLPLSTWITLPDYLWGIETLPSSSNKASISLLPDYLWGIETRSPDRQRYNLGLPDYLWGIETWNWNSLPLHASHYSLPDYLWGIETRIWWTVWRHRCASRLPMRNTVSNKQISNNWGNPE